DRKQPTRQAMGATWQGIFSNTLPTALSTRYRQPFGGARQDDLSRPSHGSAESLGQPRRPASGTVCQQLFHRKPAERECP
ncbi:ABC transporter ATP-binding protein, partial [Pseudomonas aeruginosa]